MYLVLFLVERLQLPLCKSIAESVTLSVEDVFTYGSFWEGGDKLKREDAEYHKKLAGDSNTDKRRRLSVYLHDDSSFKAAYSDISALKWMTIRTMSRENVNVGNPL